MATQSLTVNDGREFDLNTRECFFFSFPRADTKTECGVELRLHVMFYVKIGENKTPIST